MSRSLPFLSAGDRVLVERASRIGTVIRHVVRESYEVRTDDDGEVNIYWMPVVAQAGR